jgi:hypothetical protein
MIQGSNRTYLVRTPAGQRLGYDLDCDIAAHACIDGAILFSHAPLSGAQDLIGTKEIT